VKLRVVFAGTPAFALPPLAALHAAHELVGVLTQPDRPAGRGRQLTASPVCEWARQHGVPVIQPLKLRGQGNVLAEVLAQLAAWRPDVMVVVAYGMILPREILQLPRLGCLNIHASLLPRWRGAAPIQRAVQAGDAVTGVSIMQVDEGLDTGAVLGEQPLPVLATDTAGSLHDRLAAAGAPLLLRVLDALAAGSACATPQPEQGATHAAKLTRAESRVHWQGDAVAIDRQIRAFNPWPVAETTLDGESVKLLLSRVASGAHDETVARGNAPAPPGTLLGIEGDALRVACGQGVLEVLQLQRAGRRAVGAREFFNALRPGAARPVFT
jgi:methionyl-tRNA formyltransferase